MDDCRPFDRRCPAAGGPLPDRGGGRRPGAREVTSWCRSAWWRRSCARPLASGTATRSRSLSWRYSPAPWHSQRRATPLSSLRRPETRIWPSRNPPFSPSRALLSPRGRRLGGYSWPRSVRADPCTWTPRHLASPGSERGCCVPTGVSSERETSPRPNTD